MTGDVDTSMEAVKRLMDRQIGIWPRNQSAAEFSSLVATLRALAAERDALAKDMETLYASLNAEVNEHEGTRKERDALRAEVADLKQSVIAFGAPWTARWAIDHDLPPDHLHPTHYDILAKAGARMAGFTRASITQDQRP